MERKEVDSERSHTKSDSEVKKPQVHYMKKMHSLSLNSLLCVNALDLHFSSMIHG